MATYGFKESKKETPTGIARVVTE